MKQKKLLQHLIRSEFDRLFKSGYKFNDRYNELIQLAENLKLDSQFISELKNDMK